MTGTNTNYLLSIRAPDGDAQRFRVRLSGFLDEQAKAGLIQDHRLGELEVISGEAEQAPPTTRVTLREEGYETRIA